MVQETIISREVLAAILKGIDEGVHVVDITGKTIYYNEVAAAHDGLTREEVLGKHVLEAFPSLTPETSTLLKVIHSNRPMKNMTQSYVNMHGRRIETINTTYPLHVEGKLAGAVEIAKDYSKLKQLSERLVDLQKTQLLTTPKKKVKTDTVRYELKNLLTADDSLQHVKRQAEKLANSHSPILVFGESGSGKELLVQGIHAASHRGKSPFIAQNCAAIPETLLESILFGTSKGSYTGAVDRPGLFELANGGTLFLDEIHAMPAELQAKLLRVLDDGQIRRVGSTKSVKTDVRIIAAMNVHPYQALEKELIRADLFYRLNVLSLEIPPLRSRQKDILYLSDHFIEIFNQQLGKKAVQLTDEVKSIFLQYHWPGNVRELKHTIEYMMNLCEGEMLSADLLPVMLKKAERQPVKVLPLRDHMKKLEAQLIADAMLKSGGNIKKAARLLEIPRQTLQYKLKALNAE